MGQTKKEKDEEDKLLKSRPFKVTKVETVYSEDELDLEINQTVNRDRKKEVQKEGFDGQVKKKQKILVGWEEQPNWVGKPGPEAKCKGCLKKIKKDELCI